MKSHGPSPEETPVHSPENPWPQIGFLFAVAILPVWAIVDTAPRVFSMSVYPISAAVVTFIPLTLVALKLFAGRAPHVIFYDSKHEETVPFPEQRSNLHYILWLLAMLVGATLIGFVFATAAFIFVFLRVKARLSILGCAGGAAAFVLLLAVLGSLLVLEYPQGLLQDYLPMPWPFIR
jgi:hypothetical protein